MRRVFLSHAKEDSQKVKRLYQLLKTAGFTPWFDEFNLSPGHKWKSEIQQAIHKSDLFIVCLSKCLLTKRGYVQAEIKHALEVALEVPENQLYIIPVRLDGCTIPYSLKDYQCADLFTEGDIVKFIHQLQSVMSKPGASSTGNAAIIGQYKAWLKEFDSIEMEEKLLKELEIDPTDPIYNLLLVVAVLKGRQINSNSVNATMIAKLEKHLSYALSASKTRKTALFIQAYIKHDFYERKFINTHPTTQQVLSTLRSDRTQADQELIEFLRFSPVFLLKVKPLLS